MLNTAILMGRLVHDPDLKHTQSDTAVCSFTLAVERAYTPKGGEKQTDFIDIVCWRNTAEFVSKYFRKGMLVAVEGSIQTRSYEDKQGNKRKAFEVVADKAHFAEGKKKDGLDEVAGKAKSGGAKVTEGDDFIEIDGGEDLPF
jgi:single-strand DNA-binding protein